MEHPQQRAGIIAGLTAYVVWGLLTLYWKQLTGFAPLELIGWRITASAVIMAVVLTITRQWRDLAVVPRDRHLLARVALSSVLLTVNWTSYVWAVVNGRVLETALGYFIAPIGTMMVGVLVLHEPLRRAQRIALGFGVASVIVLTVSYGRVPLVALLIAVSWTGYGYLKKRVPLTPVESMAAESFLLVIPAVLVVLLSSSNADSVANSASGMELALVLSTGIATVTPLMLFAFAAHRVPLTIIGPMQYIVPSMNFLFAWVIYDEAMPPSRLIGFGLVWIGLAVLTVDSARRAHQSRSIDLEPEPVL